MDISPRWVYVYEAHVVGIGYRHTKRDSYEGFWCVTVLPDWMSIAFLNRLTFAEIGTDDPIHYVTIMVVEDKLIMGAPVETFERIDNWKPQYTSDPYSILQSIIPPTPEERMADTRILLDGVLIWGREEYPGERQIVIPKVKLPKKLSEGIPALKEVNS